MTKPFAGVRVLDFTQVFAGPFGSYQLALLGADVIKIERPGGEDMRRSPLNKEWAARNMATAWMAINSNKRNLALDLTKPKSIEIVNRLAAKADVVMENFRPGMMDRMGIGYEALSGINPRLIYCAVSGFGQTGPERTTAAYDGKIQAMSGIMSVTGHPGEGPMRAGFAVCDAIGGMTAAFAVSSALFQRTHTGRGQLVDVAMLDAASRSCPRSWPTIRSAATCRGQSATARRAGCRRPTCSRSRAGTSCWPSTTRSSSRALSRAIGLPDLASDPRFRDWPSRVANDAALRAIIEEAFAAEDDRTWEARLQQGRRALLARMVDRRDRRPSAARPPRRAAAHRHALRGDDRGRLGLPAGARRRQRRAARRRCRASTPRRCWARRATPRTKSPRCAATG